MLVKMIGSAGSPRCQHSDAAPIGLNVVFSPYIAGTTNDICWALTELLWHFLKNLGNLCLFLK